MKSLRTLLILTTFLGPSISFSFEITQATRTLTGTSDEHLSGNGQLLSFVSADDLVGQNPNKARQVFVANIGNNSGLRQLTAFSPEDNPLSSAVLSGNGALVVHVKEWVPKMAGGDGIAEIKTFPTDGSPGKVLLSVPSNGVTFRSIVVSPDGKRVAIESRVDVTGSGAGGGFDQLYVVKTDGSGLTQVTSNVSGGVSYDNLMFTADGKGLVYSTWNVDHNATDYVRYVDVATLAERTLVAGKFNYVHLSISSDAGAVAFADHADPVGENKDLRPQVFFARAPDYSIQQLTHETTLDAAVYKISTDGQRVYYMVRWDPQVTSTKHAEVLYEHSVFGSSAIELASTDTPMLFAGVHVSDDGGRAVVVKSADWSTFDFSLLDVQSKEVTPIVNMTVSMLGNYPVPRFTDDARQLLVASSVSLLEPGYESVRQVFLLNFSADAEVADEGDTASGGGAVFGFIELFAIWMLLKSRTRDRLG